MFSDVEPKYLLVIQTKASIQKHTILGFRELCSKIQRKWRHFDYEGNMYHENNKYIAEK